MDVVEHSNLTFQGTLRNVLFRTSNNSECTLRLCNTPEHLERNFKSAILRIFKSRGFPEHSKLIYTSPQPQTHYHTYPCLLPWIRVAHGIHWPQNFNPLNSMALVSVI
jgi:hypothetical protein